MKTNILFLFCIVFLASCSGGMFGKKVKEPFTGNAYESNGRFWRGVGKGVSAKDNIAEGKADLNAKAELGGQVNTTMKQVADEYLGQTENLEAADVAEKFQSLTRQVMNTSMSDLRKIGEKKYYDDKEREYTVFIAYEIKKNAMLRYMKKAAKTDQKIDERQRKVIEEVIDKELEKVGED